MMKAVLVLAVLAVFTTFADASVVPFQDNSDSPGVIYESADPSAEVTFSNEVFLIRPPIKTDFSSAPSVSRRNLSVGSIGSNDIRLLFVTVTHHASSGVTHTQDVRYSNPNRRITAVRATPTSVAGGTPVIVSGGVGQTSVHVRITSNRGGPLYYQVAVWGR